MASAGQASDLQSVVALVKSLLNSQLKIILRSEYLPVSGVKSILQTRIIECLSISIQIFLFSRKGVRYQSRLILNMCGNIDLKELSQGGQIERYNRLKKFIYATAHHPMPTTPTHSPNSIYQQPHHPAQPFPVQTKPAFSGTLGPSQPFSNGIHLHYMFIL
jgi:E3 SUMO-protein ligase PIAS1